MSVVCLYGRDPASEARALLNFMLRHGDVVGTDQAGRTILQLTVDPWTLDQLLTFDADAADLEDTDSEPEPDQEIDGPATVLDFVPLKRIGRTSRAAPTLGLALLLVIRPGLDARADQAPLVTLPLSTAQGPAQCCRVCRKGQPCGDACISSTKQCRAPSGCACSAASGSYRCSNSWLPARSPIRYRAAPITRMPTRSIHSRPVSCAKART